MTNQGPQEHTAVSHTFPSFKKPQSPIDVNKELDNNKAGSAEQATADIEKVAQTITNLSVADDVVVTKDPSSKFMTSKDLMAYQRAVNLGILRKVNVKKVIAPGGPEVTVETMINSIQGCPVCSLATNSLFQMEFVEDILKWHCFRCSLEIDPFNKVDPEILPEEQTEFGLSAIDDPGEKARNGNKDSNKKVFPLYSNRKKTETKSSWDRLNESRKKDDDLKRLRGKNRGS